MTVRHPVISADFPDVVDLDPRAGVVVRIRGRPAVRYLVLRGTGERGEGRIVPQRLLRVPRPIRRVFAERGESELCSH